MSDEGFLGRWARRKAADRQGVPLPEAPVEERPVQPLAQQTAERPAPEVVAPQEIPVPTLEDVAKLLPSDDFAPFVARGVPADVRAAAMKKLFADPHYNIMDGLDIYIDDYTKPDPIPAAMLRQLSQSKMLRLFEEEERQEELARKGEHDAPTEVTESSASTSLARVDQDALPEQAVRVSTTDEAADVMIKNDHPPQASNSSPNDRD